MTRDPLLSKIHVARAQLGLADADYRALLGRVAGVDSAARLDARGRVAVLHEFKRLGWAPRANSAGKGVKPSPKAHVRKVFALWGALERAGLLRDASRKALDAFVLRQTGVASVEWLTPEAATKVTEGLKAMLARAERATT